MLITTQAQGVSGVAVVGAGIVNPVATGVEDFAQALQSARPRLSRLEGVPIPRGKATVGLVKDASFVAPDKAFRMAAAAIDEALRASTIDPAAMDDIGVIMATMAGESHAAENFYPELVAWLDTADDAPAGVAAAVEAYPNGALLQRLCRRFGFVGPRFVVSNACASGNIAVGLALDFLRTGKCRAVVVVGVEVIKPSMIWGAERAGFVGNTLAPFHPDRDGAILGEGAAALILVDPALLREQPVLGWVDGFGSVCDRGAAPITLAEDGSGLYRAMQLALDDANRTSAQLKYVNAHAPGTRVIDAIECGAVGRLRGAEGELYINSTKSITSHLSGASAITEVIATLLQMRDSFIHGNAGLDRPDPALLVRPVGATTIRQPFDFGLSNACGGGGLNTSVAVSSTRDPVVRNVAVPAAADTPLVVTGYGVVADSGFHWRRRHDPAGTRPGGYLREFDVYRYYPVESNYHYMNRAAQLAAAAGAAALTCAGVHPQALPYPDDRFAVIFGSYLGGSPQASKVLCDGLHNNPNAITPSMALDHGIHLGAALVCRHYGLTGTTYTLTGSRRAGLQALEVAALSIRTGRAEAALVSGYDAHDAFEAALSERLALAPEPADAAGAVVLETSAHAERRRAPLLARVVDIRTLAGASTEAGRETLSAKLGHYLASHDWDELYLATQVPGSHMRLIEDALQLAGRPRNYLILGDDMPDPRAGLGMMALVDAIARGVNAAIVAPGDDGTAIAVIVAVGERRARDELR